jgi:hypothetical protein
MRISSVRTGDIVYANKRGRLFHGKVVGIEADGILVVEPIERNISYRHVDASEIIEHWARSPKAQRATRTPTTTQPTLELPLAF